MHRGMRSKIICGKSTLVKGFLSSINDSVESLPQDEEFEQAKQQFFFGNFI